MLADVEGTFDVMVDMVEVDNCEVEVTELDDCKVDVLVPVIVGSAVVMVTGMVMDSDVTVTVTGVLLGSKAEDDEDDVAEGETDEREVDRVRLDECEVDVLDVLDETNVVEGRSEVLDESKAVDEVDCWDVVELDDVLVLVGSPVVGVDDP